MRIYRIAAMVAVLVVAYFANVYIQTHLGEKTLKASGLNYYSLEEAISLAEQESKLVFADMSAIWCPSCRKLDREVFSNQEVQQALNERFVFARIEYESKTGEAFRERYNVSSFPTLLVLDSQGNLLTQIDAVFDPDQFLKALARVTPTS